MEPAGKDPEFALHVQLEDHASAMFLAGLYKHARAAIERSIGLRSQCYHAHMLHSSILIQLNLNDEALAACDRCLALSPEDPEAYAEKAEVLCIQRRYEEAETVARKALSLHQTYRYQDDFEDEADAAAERDWQSWVIYTTIAGIFQARGSLSKAFEVVAEAEIAGVDRDHFQFLNRPLLRSV